VVASFRDRDGGARRRRVSIPFIAGQWSLPRSNRVWRRLHHVSIPFIAGQWSLRLENQLETLARLVSIPFIAGQWSLRSPQPRPPYGGPGFNPLHCGAVVASCRGGPMEEKRQVSIPFIAGQWSLPLVGALARAIPAMFQSPSLRGSGRFG